MKGNVINLFIIGVQNNLDSYSIPMAIQTYMNNIGEHCVCIPVDMDHIAKQGKNSDFVMNNILRDISSCVSHLFGNNNNIKLCNIFINMAIYSQNINILNFFDRVIPNKCKTGVYLLNSIKISLNVDSDTIFQVYPINSKNTYSTTGIQITENNFVRLIYCEKATTKVKDSSGSISANKTDVNEKANELLSGFKQKVTLEDTLSPMMALEEVEEDIYTKYNIKRK